MTTEQYLTLSALAYTNLTGIVSDSFKPSINYLIGNIPIKDYKDAQGNINPQFFPLSSLGNWQLIAYQPSVNSGFSGCAFKSPEGEIVFAFRGTDNWLSGDGITNILGIASGGPLINSQFGDAYNFVKAAIFKLLNNVKQRSLPSLYRAAPSCL